MLQQYQCGTPPWRGYSKKKKKRRGRGEFLGSAAKQISGQRTNRLSGYIVPFCRVRARGDGHGVTPRLHPGTGGRMAQWYMLRDGLQDRIQALAWTFVLAHQASLSSSFRCSSSRNRIALCCTTGRGFFPEGERGCGTTH